MSRRRFLRAALATGTLGMAGIGGAAYYAESQQLAAPLPPGSEQAAPLDTNASASYNPILLIVNQRATPSFGTYLGHILAAEGLMGYRTVTFDALTQASLARSGVVVMSAGPVSAAHAAMLEQFVISGGRLVAMQPDPRLDHLFGVRSLGGSSRSGYLLVHPQHPAAVGIDPGPLQFHGMVRHVALDGAAVVATLNQPNGLPLVTSHRYGQGHTIYWAFDLPRSVALTRQGNPFVVGQEQDGIPGLRAADLFIDWIDLDRIQVPQADEQQRLLVHTLNLLAADHAPLPRLWYFPNGAKALLVATGDAHGLTPAPVEALLQRIEAYNGTFSVYYTPVASSAARRMLRRVRQWAGDMPVVGPALAPAQNQPTAAQVRNWRERGHEFGMHPYVEVGLEEGYNAYWNDFLKHGYGPLPPTVRTHRILWQGWVDTARTQAHYGLRMNLDHYHVGPAVRKADGSWTRGYLSGSGLPMPFVDEDGTVLSVYQQPTHLVDEHLMNVFGTGFDAGLDGASAAEVTRAQIDESMERYPAALGLQCHVDAFALGDEQAQNVGQWLDQTLAYAASHNLPIMSAERWLAFTEARNAARVSYSAWNSEQGQWTLHVQLPPATATPMELLLPLRHGERSLHEVRLGNAPLSWQTRSLSTGLCAGISLVGGQHQLQILYRSA
ncbi:MAG: hypothetical protein MUD01_24805 [Chloroflexaceae bacterium]|jgi:hypothetical protein|nr:hypothetical protein [Chloroflexaceae bacterium]